MKKFIFKIILLLFPFAFLYVLTLVYSVTDQSPDVLRLGNLPNLNKDYRSKFQTEFENEILYSELSNGINQKSTILTIGDSFSEQDGFGYKNYVSKSCNVLHVDRFISKNQIQTLYELLNGDFFIKANIKYVVLQNVERHFIDNSMDVDTSKKMMVSDIENRIAEHKPEKQKAENKLFSKKIFTFLTSMVRFFLKDNYLSNGKIYNLNMNTTKLFSNHSNKLLFYYKDLKSVPQNNSIKEVQNLNRILNDLSLKLNEKGIQLIVLPAPDKYDMYYSYIENKTNYPKPLFFELLDTLNKNYIYINSKQILSKLLDKKQDIYFYDDTHWSPIAAKAIAEEIIYIVSKSMKVTFEN